MNEDAEKHGRPSGTVSTQTLLARIVGILNLVEKSVTKIYDDVIDRNDEIEIKTSVVIADLTKLMQLLEKQYSLLRTVEKEQQEAIELPKPNEALIRSYLNKKHEKLTRAEKSLQKGKHKHVSFD